jgi:hypothetical protein
MTTARRSTARPVAATRVIRCAAAAVDRWNQRGRFQLRLLADSLVRKGDWINLVIRPQVPGVPGLAYLEALEAIESDIHAKGCDKVIVMPAVGD